MIKEEKNKEDLLKQYISPAKIERAPEGFTSEVMTRIQMEAVPQKSFRRFRNRNLIPVISFFVTILLIAAAFLTPGNQTDSLIPPVADFIKNMKISLPDISISSIFSFNLPALMIYVLIGILFLSILDRALRRLFYRRY